MKGYDDDDDYDEEWDKWGQLMSASGMDDKDWFMDVLKPFPHSSEPPNAYLLSSHGRSHGYEDFVRVALEHACMYSGTECVKELLCGPASRYVNLNGIIEQRLFYSTRPLSLACVCPNIVIIDLLLQHGACADFVEPPGSDWEGLLPLNIALKGISDHKFIEDWILREDSIFKLIFILCLPQTRGILECIRMLANKTSLVESIFSDYLNAGRLLEAAVLLMVAGDKILDPPSSPCGSEKDCNLVDEGNALTVLFLLRGNALTSSPAKLLVEVFDKVGYELNCYLRYQLHCQDFKTVSKDEVIEHVSLVLEKAGFCLTDRDTDLSNIDCENPDFKLATEAVGRFLLDVSSPDQPLSSTNHLTQGRCDPSHSPLFSVGAFCNTNVTSLREDNFRCDSITHTTGRSAGYTNWKETSKLRSTQSIRDMSLTNKRNYSAPNSSLYSVWAFNASYGKVNKRKYRPRRVISRKNGRSNGNMRSMGAHARAMSTVSKQGSQLTNKISECDQFVAGKDKELDLWVLRWEQRSDALYADDKNKLMNLLKPFPFPDEPRNSSLFSIHDTCYLDFYRSFARDTLEMACLASAVDCVKELLCGPAARYINLNIKSGYSSSSFARPLALACMDLNIVIIDLLLRHGACADLVEPDRSIVKGLIPIDIALGAVSRHKFLENWTPEKDSIFKLIFILCLPQTRGILECMKMLANKTSMVESIFFDYLNAGHHLEAAVLLMVAGDKILDPRSPPSGGEDCNKLAEGNSYSSSSPSRLLVEVFNKVGHELKFYLQYQLHCQDFKNVSKDEVIEHVSLVVKKAGFSLTDADTDLSNIDCGNSGFKLATEAVGRFLLNVSCPDLPPLSSPNMRRHGLPDSPLYSAHGNFISQKTDKSSQMNRMGIQARGMSTVSDRCMRFTSKVPQSLASKYLPCHPIFRSSTGFSEMNIGGSEIRVLDKLHERCLPSRSKFITTFACAIRTVLQHM